MSCTPAGGMKSKNISDKPVKYRSMTAKWIKTDISESVEDNAEEQVFEDDGNDDVEGDDKTEEDVPVEEDNEIAEVQGSEDAVNDDVYGEEQVTEEEVNDDFSVENYDKTS